MLPARLRFLFSYPDCIKSLGLFGLKRGSPYRDYITESILLSG